MSIYIHIYILSSHDRTTFCHRAPESSSVATMRPGKLATRNGSSRRIREVDRCWRAHATLRLTVVVVNVGILSGSRPRHVACRSPERNRLNDSRHNGHSGASGRNGGRPRGVRPPGVRVLAGYSIDGLSVGFPRVGSPVVTRTPATLEILYRRQGRSSWPDSTLILAAPHAVVREAVPAY